MTTYFPDEDALKHYKFIPFKGRTYIGTSDENAKSLIFKPVNEGEMRGHLMMNEILQQNPSLPYIQSKKVTCNIDGEDIKGLVMYEVEGQTLYEFGMNKDRTELEILEVLHVIFKYLPIREKLPLEPCWSKDIIVQWDEQKKKLIDYKFIDYSYDCAVEIEEDKEILDFKLIDTPYEATKYTKDEEKDIIEKMKNTYNNLKLFGIEDLGIFNKKTEAKEIIKEFIDIEIMVFEDTEGIGMSDKEWNSFVSTCAWYKTLKKLQE